MQYLLDNIWMVVIAVTSGMMLLWSFFGNRIRGIKDVDSVAAIDLINHKNAVILDVRTRFPKNDHSSIMPLVIAITTIQMLSIKYCTFILLFANHEF